MERFTNNIEGWMNEDELSFLFTISKKTKTVVEVGSWKGKSTHALLCGCNGTVIAVDHFQGSQFERENAHLEAVNGDVYSQFMKNVGSFKNLKVFKTDSLSASKEFKDKSVDMVFIDGGHTYEEVKADIEAWLPKTKKMICGHDYGFEGVIKAVQEQFGNNFNTVSSIWVYDIPRN
jgi:predicted O-methyltransferase YrrM